MKLFRLWLLTTLGCSATQHDAAVVAPAAHAVAAPSVVEQGANVALPADSVQSAVAAPVAAAPVDVLAALPPASHSTSIGSPTNGRLEGGVALPLTAPGLRHNDRRSREARYGTVEMVRAIIRAAAEVERDFPGSELLVNDLGFERGGAISHHGSHRAGRDADILFYLLDDTGKPRPPIGAPIEPSGTGFDYGELSLAEDDVRVHFDAARTWRLVRALLEDREADVQRIFVVEHLRAVLLSEAERSHAPAEVVARFGQVSCQPSYAHDDHLHVRWYCSLEDLALGCEDSPPLYPWREAALEAAAIKPVRATRQEPREPAEVVTNEQAEREVLKQQPHAEVLAFLQRRKAWEKQPHPGRPYCR